MFKNKFLFSVVFAIILANLVNADVPPPSNEMRVSTDLQISVNADVSDFRFFLTFTGFVKEVEIKSNSPNIIESGGGGARFNSGILYAVPKKSLKDLGDKPSREKLDSIADSLENNKFEGAIKLLKHQFTQDIPIKERDKFTFPTYTIERTGETLKASENLQITPKMNDEEVKIVKGNKDLHIFGMEMKFTPLFYILFGGIILFSLALVIFGVRKLRNNR